MVLKTKNGIELTDEIMEQIAEAFERGEWPGTHSRIVKGRPMLFGEQLQSVTFKVPKQKVEEIDRKAATLNISRSDYLRSLLDKDLATA
jgi:hypothetical protein